MLKEDNKLMGSDMLISIDCFNEEEAKGQLLDLYYWASLGFILIITNEHFCYLDYPH